MLTNDHRTGDQGLPANYEPLKSIVMPEYNFNKQNHMAISANGYQVQKEGWNYDGDVVITYYNPQTHSYKYLLRPDNDQYTGIVPKWEADIL